MVFGGAVQAGQAVARLTMDDQTQKDMKRWASRAKAFAIASTVFAGAAAAVRKFAVEGDKIHKMSQRTGIAAKELSALGFAAEKGGASLENVENAVTRMNASVRDAGLGLSTAKDAFADLGMSVEELADMSVEDRFKTIAKAISSIEDEGQRAAVAMKIFGRSGTAVLPMLKGLEAEMMRAEQLGATISDEQAAAAARLNDAWTELTTALSGLIRDGAQPLAEALTVATEAVTAFAGAIRHQKHAELGGKTVFGVVTRKTRAEQFAELAKPVELTEEDRKRNEAIRQRIERLDQERKNEAARASDPRIAARESGDERATRDARLAAGMEKFDDVVRRIQSGALGGLSEVGIFAGNKGGLQAAAPGAVGKALAQLAGLGGDGGAQAFGEALRGMVESVEDAREQLSESTTAPEGLAKHTAEAAAAADRNAREQQTVAHRQLATLERIERATKDNRIRVG